jgi:phage-related tail fiber protein
MLTPTERDARIAEAERLWHRVALTKLAVGDVGGAVAAVYQYGADLDRIAAA